MIGMSLPVRSVILIFTSNVKLPDRLVIDVVTLSLPSKSSTKPLFGFGMAGVGTFAVPLCNSPWLPLLPARSA